MLICILIHEMCIDSSLYIYFHVILWMGLFFSHGVTMKSLFCLSCSITFSWCLFKFSVGIGFVYRIQSFLGSLQGVLLILGILQREKGCIWTLY